MRSGKGRLEWLAVSFHQILMVEQFWKPVAMKNHNWRRISRERELV